MFAVAAGPFAGKPRSYRIRVALVGARLAREGAMTNATIFPAGIKKGHPKAALKN